MSLASASGGAAGKSNDNDSTLASSAEHTIEPSISTSINTAAATANNNNNNLVISSGRPIVPSADVASNNLVSLADPAVPSITNTTSPQDVFRSSTSNVANEIASSIIPPKGDPRVVLIDLPRSRSDASTAGCKAMYHTSASKSVKVYVKFSRDKSVLDSQLHKLQTFDCDPLTQNKFVRAYKVIPPEAIFGLPENSVWRGAHCLVQEYGHCDLGAYLQALRDAGGVDPTDIVSEAKQLVSIVIAAHKSGWALLDIKESNFVRVHNESIGKYTVKAIDLETAVEVGRANRHHLDPSGQRQVHGTPTYVSPEMARWLLNVEPVPASIDLLQADIWAVGVTLWKMFDPKGLSMWESDLYKLTEPNEILRRLTTITNQEITRCINFTFRDDKKGSNVKIRSFLMKVRNTYAQANDDSMQRCAILMMLVFSDRLSRSIHKIGGQPLS